MHVNFYSSVDVWSCFVLLMCCFEQGTRHYSCCSLCRLRILSAAPSQYMQLVILWLVMVVIHTEYPSSLDDYCLWLQIAKGSLTGPSSPTIVVHWLHDSLRYLGHILGLVSGCSYAANARWTRYIR